MEADFLAMAAHAVTLELVTGHDVYGRPTYGAPTSVPAHIEERFTTVRNDAGEEVMVSTVVYLMEALSIAPGSRVTLPDGTRRDVVTSTRIADQDDWHNTVLYI